MRLKNFFGATACNVSIGGLRAPEIFRVKRAVRIEPFAVSQHQTRAGRDAR